MPVTLLPAIQGGQPAPCEHKICSPRQSVFHPESFIAVGFGAAYLSRDGVEVWSEAADATGRDDLIDNAMTGEQAEEIAAADPDHDWRIHLHGPLRGSVYQRHGKSLWVLVETDNGFA